MAQQHDLFDDIIDITKGIDVLKDPLGGVTDALLGTTTAGAPVQEWNPADYKERPRVNALPCLTCKSEKSTCRKCAEVCPVNAVDIDDGEVEITDACRKCGLCVPVCPTEAVLSPKIQPKKLYDAVAAAATAHTTAYVTCTRALGRNPEPNEVVLPCVAALGPETLFAVMCDYPNVSVYLPLGIKVESDVTWSANSGYGDGFKLNETLWNASLSKSFLKNNQGTLRVKIYDILRQRSNISRSITANYTQDAEYNTLGSYFMVHFIYRFSLFKGGATQSDARGPGRAGRRGPMGAPTPPPPPPGGSL